MLSCLLGAGRLIFAPTAHHVTVHSCRSVGIFPEGGVLLPGPLASSREQKWVARLRLLLRVASFLCWSPPFDACVLLYRRFASATAARIAARALASASAPAPGIPGGNSISIYTLAFNVYLHSGVAFLPVLLAKGIGSIIAYSTR